MPLWNIETSSAYERIYIEEAGKDEVEQNEKLIFRIDLPPSDRKLDLWIWRSFSSLSSLVKTLIYITRNQV